MNILNINILYCIVSKCFKDAKSTIFDIVQKIKYIAPSFLEMPVRWWICDFDVILRDPGNVTLSICMTIKLLVSVDCQTVKPYNVNAILCFLPNFLFQKDGRAKMEKLDNV